MLPNFLIIGTEKAGTTWFYSRLKQHPDIFLPETKELHFFNRYNSNLEEIDRYTKLGLAWYKRFFRKANGNAAVGEVTPMYLSDPIAVERIKDTLPEAKLICCLRDPVDRAYSHYWMARWKGHTDLSFEEVVAQREARFVQRGLYGRQLARYFERFPKAQILPLVYEEVFADPARCLEHICTFLQVDPAFYQAKEDDLAQREYGAAAYRSTFLYSLVGRVAKRMRTTKGLDIVLDKIKATGLAHRVKSFNRKEQQYAPITEELRARLAQYYRPDLELLESLLGRDLNCWTIGLRQRREDVSAR